MNMKKKYTNDIYINIYFSINKYIIQIIKIFIKFINLINLKSSKKIEIIL
jgi:hypothetical protein